MPLKPDWKDTALLLTGALALALAVAVALLLPQLVAARAQPSSYVLTLTGPTGEAQLLIDTSTCGAHPGWCDLDLGNEYDHLAVREGTR